MQVKAFARCSRALLSLVAVIVGAASLLGCAQAADGTTAKSGAFEIAVESHRESAHGPDMRPFQTRRVFTFKLSHNGKTIAFAATPRTDGGKVGPPVAVLDKAYFVGTAAETTALVATNGDTFLVTESQGLPVVTRLLSAGFKGYQWLDGADGAPGSVVFEPATGAEQESRSLTEGKLLLLYDNSGIKLGVLDIPRRAFHPLVNADPMQRSSQEIYSDDYRANGMVPGRARALSPARSQFVMAGTRYEGDKPAISLIVVDFVQGKHKIVALDGDGMRLNAFQKMTPQWIDRYYTWTLAPDGSEQLSARRPVPKAPWTGFLTDRSVESAAYRLLPVSPDMRDIFISHLEGEHGAVRLQPKPGQISQTLQIGPDKFDVTYYATNHTLVFEPATGLYTESAIAACQSIATGFDQRLKEGANQASFTRFAAGDLWAER